MCGIKRCGKVWGARRGTFKCSCFWISWGNWVPHRRVPKRLGNLCLIFGFCILNFGHSFSHTTHHWVFLACLYFFWPMQTFFHMNFIFPKKNQGFILIYMVLHGFTWWTSVNHLHLHLLGFTWFRVNLHDFTLTLTWCVFLKPYTFPTLISTYLLFAKYDAMSPSKM